MRPTLIVCMLIVSALSVAACSSAPAPTPLPSEPTGAVVPGRGTAPAPGLTSPDSGPAVAYGWVVRSDVEGGFWALVDAAPTQSAVQPRVVVVLLPGVVPESDIARLEGAYARATGTIDNGVSTRMSGPEMKVDSISGAQDRVPK